MLVNPKIIEIPHIPPAIIEIAQTLKLHHKRCWVVGGAVRDFLLGKTPKDWDLCSDATPTQVMAWFSKPIPTGIQHGTVTVMLDGEGFEITTLRVDGFSSDGRHPDRVEFTTNLREDLARRDLTINAMAWDPITKELHDPFRGRQDLEDRIIRSVGKPAERFTEDALRMLRALRFCAVLDFHFESNTFRAIKECAHLIPQVSRERIRDEWNKILEKSKAPGWSFSHMIQTGLMGHIDPQWSLTGDLLWSIMQDLEATSDPVARWSMLLQFHPDPAQWLRDWKFSVKQAEAIALPIPWINAVHNLHIWDRKRCKQLLRAIGVHWITVVNIWRAKRPNDQWIQWVEDQLFSIVLNKEPLEVKDLVVNGGDIITALKIKPGPQLGQILKGLLDVVLDDPSLNTKSALLELARDMLR